MTCPHCESTVVGRRKQRSALATARCRAPSPARCRNRGRDGEAGRRAIGHRAHHCRRDASANHRGLRATRFVAVRVPSVRRFAGSPVRRFAGSPADFRFHQ